MKQLKWFERHFEEVVLVACISYIAICMVIQVFMRRVMNNSLSWSEESIRYVFIWMMFMGLGIGVRDGKHIRITAVENMLSTKAKYVLTLFSDVVFIGYSCFIFYNSVNVFLSFFGMQQKSAALGLPMHYVYLAAPVGFGLLLIRLIQKVVGDLRRGWNPKEEIA